MEAAASGALASPRGKPGAHPDAEAMRARARGAEEPAGGAEEIWGARNWVTPTRPPPHKGPRGGRPQAQQPRPRVPASTVTHR